MLKVSFILCCHKSTHTWSLSEHWVKILGKIVNYSFIIRKAKSFFFILENNCTIIFTKQASTFWKDKTHYLYKIIFSFSFRHLLHHCFQALMDHGVKVASVLAYSFSRRCSYIAESDAAVKEKAIQVGFVLGK